jgi:hypothetical protein
MIRSTFSILNGIGEKLERRLWGEGLLTWEDFLSSPAPEFISPERKGQFDAVLSDCLRELSTRNSKYFRGVVKGREHWRLFDSFRGEAVCLDIETNGFQPDSGGYVTMVGLYDGFDYKCLVRGNGLTPDDLLREVSGYKYLITFFGSGFDLPFIKRSLGVDIDQPHFDLCFGARRLGLRGGLKKLEARMGFRRDEAVSGMDGYDAVLLWEKFRRGSEEALDLLVRYNREDTVNLMGIAAILYDGLKASTGIEAYTKTDGLESCVCP